MPLTENIQLPADELRDFATRMFVAAGVPRDEALQVAESLIDSNLCGHESHGVVRVLEYLDAFSKDEVRANVSLKIVSQTAAAIACDGQFGFGQVQMRRLIERLAPMAREQGVACGTVRRCGHIGRLGEWAERIAEAGLAGLLSVNDNGVLTCVAPPGGIVSRISTNPIAIGAPATTEPLVLDISTSMVANGKVRVAQLAGQQCPDGWLIDAAGEPTNDPNVRWQDPPGTLLPMGGYKGFGLGLLLDVLVGGLSGGFCPPAPSGEVECNNVLCIVFDPERFSGREHFETQCAGLAQSVRTTPRRADAAEIRLPNDRSRRLRNERTAQGVPLDAGTWGALQLRAEQLGVRLPAVTNIRPQ